MFQSLADARSGRSSCRPDENMNMTFQFWARETDCIDVPRGLLLFVADVELANERTAVLIGPGAQELADLSTDAHIVLG